MESPDLDRIVDTFFQIKDLSLKGYIDQLRLELIPYVKSLCGEGRIIWFAFLVHGQDNLNGRVSSTDTNLYVHIRLCPPKNVSIEDLKQRLPSHFINPQVYPCKDISGVDYPHTLKNHNLAHAWKLFGETSEWVLRLIEAHDSEAQIPVQHIIQFLHFATNPLLIGQQSRFLPTGQPF